MSWVYNDDHSRIVLPNGKPHSVKKVTGTRFAGVLGLNTWSTPFQMWCEITKIAQPPFSGNIYTEAGITIEPKVIQWLKDDLSSYTVSPEEYYGLRYPDMRYDFFPHSKRYGGMWDAKIMNKDNKCRRVVEIKTTKRSEDWIDGPPLYYVCQVLLYAYLDQVEDVILTCTFLEDDDYNHPERFIVTDENTQMWTFKVSETEIPYNGLMYTIDELINIIDEWYATYVETGISPEFDEEKDKEYLDILRAMHPEYDKALEDIIAELEHKEYELTKIYEDLELDDLEKSIKTLKEAVKSKLLEQLDTDSTKDTIQYGSYKLKKSTKKSVDTDKLKADGLYDEYLKQTETTTLTKVKTKK